MKMKSIAKSLVLMASLFFAASALCFAQPANPPTSIAYAYNPKTNSYYYYALEGTTLYYLNHDTNANKWTWVKWDASPFPASSGFISVNFDKSGNRYVEALGSDGNLYELHVSPLEQPAWIKDPSVQTLTGTPTCLVYYYGQKEDSWFVRTMVNGQYEILQWDDGAKAYAWKPYGTIPALSGSQTLMAGGVDKDGNASIYALSDGKLSVLSSTDNGKTFTWTEAKDTDPLPAGQASFTFYYGENGDFFMYAALNGQEYQLTEDANKHWHWQKTSITFLQ